MEVFKLGKIVENKVIDVQLALHKLEEAREELQKSLKRRKDIAIAENDINYKEIDTIEVFSNGDTKEFDVAIAELMEVNKSQVEEIRTLKIEQESQAIMLCEVTEKKKRAIEEKSMTEDDKRNLTNILEENTIEFERVSNI